MLSYKTFCKAIDVIKKKQEQDLAAYNLGIELTEKWVDTTSVLVRVLTEAMQDRASLITWWIYDAKFGTDLEISCSYKVNGELRPLPTKKALYEELIGEAVGVDE